MPFFKCEAGLVLFCHVPKCGGTTVEGALLDSGFNLSFLDEHFWKNIDEVWYKSSPQHMTNNDFKQLFANDIFTYKFAIVRNPISRLLSAFNHNRNKIGRFSSFNSFLSRLEKNVSSQNNYFGAMYDNHFVPANRLVLEGCEVFHLESGMTGIEDRLFKLTRREISLKNRRNSGSYEIQNAPGVKGAIENVILPPSPQKKDLTSKTIERIKLLYKEDYERFDFE